MEKLQQCSRVDRISDLPDSLICYVLSFLPTEFVVPTSVLSRRWKYLWTQVTTLDFDDQIYFHSVSTESMNFVQFVNEVLLRINAECLEVFRLTLSWEYEAVYVNRWVSYAISRNVGVLDLSFLFPDESDDSLVHLPGTLFTLGNLESLSLCGSILITVPCVVCLPKLEILNLSSVHYESDECVHKLIAGCPVLHSLTIERGCSDNVRVYKISSPSLKCLEICADDEPDSDEMCEIDAPALESLVCHDHVWKDCSVKRLESVNEADLCFYPDHDFGFGDGCFTDRCNSTVKVIQALARVKFLRLGGSIMKALSNATTPLMSSAACFERLTKLDIEWDYCHWSSLKLMLEFSSNLQVLNITMLGCVKDTDHEECWKDPMFVPKCLLFSLQQISFRGFEGLQDEMAMIRYILKHGVVLKLVELQSPAEADDSEDSDGGDFFDYKSRMLQEISMFPRYSRTCEIKFD